MEQREWNAMKIQTKAHTYTCNKHTHKVWVQDTLMERQSGDIIISVQDSHAWKCTLSHTHTSTQTDTHSHKRTESGTLVIHQLVQSHKTFPGFFHSIKFLALHAIKNCYFETLWQQDKQINPLTPQPQMVVVSIHILACVGTLVCVGPTGLPQSSSTAPDAKQTSQWYTQRN